MLSLLHHTRYMQYLSAFFASLSISSCGMFSSWASPSLSKLQSDDSPIGRPITDEEGSWIVSSFLLSATIFALFGGYAIDILGRKGSLLFSSTGGILPWLMIAFGKSIEIIYAARILAGSLAGICVITGAVYSTEIAEEDVRGRLSSITIIVKIMGSLYVLTVGPYISYRALALSCCVEPIALLLLSSLMPETPYFYVKKGKLVKAKETVIKLSRKDADEEFIASRMSLIKTTVENDMRNKTTVREFLCNKQYKRSIILMAGIKSTQQLGGFCAVEAYMQRIIELTRSKISPEKSSVIFGFIQLPAVIISGLLVDKIGRRPLFIISGLGSAVALFGTGFYFFIQDYLQEDTSAITWLPTCSIAMFLVMNPLGLSTLPYLFVGEFFPTNIKGIAVSLCTVYGGFLAFVVSKLFKPLSNMYGSYTMFWVFSGVSILGSIFVMFNLPETKGKSFAEIQEMLNNKESVWINDKDAKIGAKDYY